MLQKTLDHYLSRPALSLPPLDESARQNLASASAACRVWQLCWTCWERITSSTRWARANCRRHPNWWMAC